MIDIYLMLWSALLTLEVFASYMMVTMVEGEIFGYFPAMFLLLGAVFLWLVNKRRKQLHSFDIVLYKGYETSLLYATYILLFSVCILIIMGIYTNISPTSPVVLLTWLLPMYCYTTYQAIWGVKDNKLYIQQQNHTREIKATSIQRIEILPKRKKVIVQIETKKEIFKMTGMKKEILLCSEVLKKQNKQIKVKEGKL